MTDITELAQREKFEAWWEREYKHLESSKYTDAVPHIKYGFWMAYQAGGAELVEALEKAQAKNALVAGGIEATAKLHERIAELESIREAAEKLVRCKGRYHSEQKYRALAALFGVKTPDLPPLDSESIAVTVKLTDINDHLAEVHDKTLNRAFRLLAEGVRAGDVAAMRAAGIKVEAE
ncbi:hypothetical protein [Klebsiella variicola]|uniref:hypothetical protein n=1 Tax=Klebsiella variicola TaxID=244366 RepID=UPI0035AB9207